MKAILPYWVFVSFFFCLGCEREESNTKNIDEPPLFTLLPQEKTGISFRNDLEEDVNDETKNILSFDYFFNGAGVAIGDINNDDLPDVLLVGNEVDNRLYLNKGGMQFEDITDRAGINKNKKWATGATMADVDGDGNLDIYICQGGQTKQPWEEKANLLFLNNGDLTFTEKGKELGLDDTNISTQAAFFDFDRDGDLDCFVLNESKYTMVVHAVIFEDLKIKENLERASSNLYRNDNGHYVKVTEEAGMLQYGFGLGMAISDINMDGWPDVYVANDYSVPDFIYINNGDGTFTDQTKGLTNQLSFYSMGMDIADINNDGLLDIGVVDMAADDHIRDKTLMASMNTEMFWYYINTRGYHYQYMFNALQLNNGNGTFSNIANMAGVARSDWSWAALFADFDNDGYKDYFVTNGYRRYARDNDFKNAMQEARDANGGSIPLDQRQKFYDMMPTIKLPNRMYRNNGQLHFDPVEKEWGTDQPSYSNGAAYADLDLDGDLDLVVNNVDMEAFVYRNNATEISTSHFLRVRLKAKDPATPIANSLVRIYYNGHQQVQELMNTRGYESAVEEVLHFGLGDYEKVDTLVVKWPNGKTQLFTNVKADQVLVVVMDENDYQEAAADQMPLPLFKEIDASDLGVGFVHLENEYDDFAKEVLLPQKQSTQGPCLSVADVDGDGLDDFFVGGAAGQSGLLYIQDKNGRFSADLTKQLWAFNKASEEVGSLFFDADGDGDPDLYIVCGGGGEFQPNSSDLQDRLYINTGGGKFMQAVQSLPSMIAAGSCVRAADYDGDGDLDLFVGGRAVPGKYPYPSRSYILNFDNFKYSDVTEQVAPALLNPGMVNDAVWTDFNNDKLPDLVVVGEWMTPSFYQNNGGSFTNVTKEKGLDNLNGWWYSLAAADVDGDGDEDLICGNLGLNSKFHASNEKPFNVFAGDFDENGTCDIVLSKEYKGKLVPTRGRQCSSEQMPFIADKFPSYNLFASAGVEDIFSKEKLESSLHLEVKDFESKTLLNNGNGTYTVGLLPRLAQMAPINGIIPIDINGDGNMDLICAGNMYETEVETPRYDAGTGLVMLGDGKGGFTPMRSDQSGFFTPKNVKNIALLKRAKDRLIVVANNNGPLQFFAF